MADGQPQTQVMWVDADEEHTCSSTPGPPPKYKNVERDPRVTVTVWNASNPYQYVGCGAR